MPIALTEDSKPQLRWPLDITKIESNGTQLYLVRDPSGVATEALTVPSAAMAIISRFDGATAVSEIVRQGQLYGVTPQIVLALAEDLDKHHYLQTAETARRWDSLKEEFRLLSIRDPAHAGLVYASNADELRSQIQRYIDQAEVIPTHPLHLDRIAALITPHIDYHRGWKTYGAAYKSLVGMVKPDVVFLLGTSHQPGNGFYHLTDKSFATPLGVIETEREVVADLARKAGAMDLFADEILHKREHSLELQLPFIHHFFGNQTSPPKIVPILVGSFHEFLSRGQLPCEAGEVGDFVGALAEVTKSLRVSGKRVLFYGGVDLAHMGRHFGDPEQVSLNGLPEIERRDRELIDCILQADERRLFAHMAEDLDRRRICGFPSIYTMISAMKQAGMTLRGHPFEYRQAVDPRTDCIVTFASAAWEEL